MVEHHLELARIMPSVLVEYSERYPSMRGRLLTFVAKLQKRPRPASLNLKPLRGQEGLWRAKDGDLRAILIRGEKKLHLRRVGPRQDIYNHLPSATVPSTEEELPETIRENKDIRTYPVKPPVERLFDGHTDTYLLSLGVPANVLPMIRNFRNSKEIETAWDEGYYGDDVVIRLWDLAKGEYVVPPRADSMDQPDDAPDARPSAYVIEDEKLRRCLNAPWERWITFLSREQREVVEKEFRGPAKVTGSAGTGKTVVALHRVGRLAEAGRRVLLTTYGKTLAQNLERALGHIIDDLNARNRITVSTVHARARAMVGEAGEQVEPVGARDAHAAVEAALRESVAGRLRFSHSEVVAEWDEVIQLQGIVEWDQYRAAKRHGRGRQMYGRDRKILWDVFEGARRRLASRNQVTWSDLCGSAAGLLRAGRLSSPFDAVIVDEVQDLSVPDLRFLWQLGRHCPENVMVVGDAGQRIYPGGYSLGRLGIDIRGRSTRLRTNYRTTREIRRLADTVGRPQVDDMDSGDEKRNDTQDDRLGGPDPARRSFSTEHEEHRALVDQVKVWMEHGTEDTDIGVFVRTNGLADKIVNKLTRRGIKVLRLRSKTNLDLPGVRIGTMHRAKGLEFKNVWVAGVKAGVVPHRSVLQATGDGRDPNDAVNLERSLLYVAMTRARHQLTVSWAGRCSEFLSNIP